MAGTSLGGGTRIFTPAGAGAWSVMESHEALIAEDSFTFSFPAENFDNVSMLVITVDANPTSFVTLQLRINGDLSANYFVDGRDITNGSLLVIDRNIQNQIQLCRNTNNSFAGMVKIFLEKASIGTNFPMTISEFNDVGIPTNSQYVGRLNKDTSSISSLEIRTSSPAWRAGSRMTLYKVSR